MESLILNLFRQFYKKAEFKVSSIESREFGFLFFKKSSMLRHVGFSSVSELKHFVLSKIPAHIYYSCALYQHPKAKMGQKGFLGADLVFDIDADHLPAKCRVKHDRWFCLTCGMTGLGVKPERCPACRGKKIKALTWFCEECLSLAKEHTVKLVDFLQEDFGFSSKNVKIVFSGHRGYHVHVAIKEVQKLNADERREIVDYVMGNNLKVNPFTFGIIQQGWRKRIAEEIATLLNDNKLLKELKIPKNTLKSLIQNRKIILKTLKKGTLPRLKWVGEGMWQKIISFAVQRRRVLVDGVVTVDLHRLIRLPGSLHGKTGFKVTVVSNLESFDPFVDAPVFREGFLKVKVSHFPGITLLGKKYPPAHNTVLTVPKALGVLLVLKGVGEVVRVG